MKNDKSASLKLIITFLLFIILWFISSLNPMLSILWFIVISILSIVFIMENKNISKVDIIIGILLGVISMPSNFIMGIVSIFAYIGGISVFKKSNNKIPLLKSNKRKNVFKTTILGVSVGIILGIINFYMGKAGLSINVSFKLMWLLDAIRAGVTEEIIFRFFFFAICVWVTKDKKLSKFENFLCYLIITVPHTIIHFDRTNFELGGLIILSLMFGLPFAIMQRKQDLSSAIGAHAIVDLIRFTVFGV